MSWDIFLQDLPRDAKKISDISTDFRPQSINKTRNEITKIIADMFPQADFSDKSWGHLDGDGFSIEFNLGNAENVESFALHVRGNNIAAVGVVGRILRGLDLRAVSSGSDEILDGMITDQAFGVWGKYRDQMNDNSKIKRS